MIGIIGGTVLRETQVPAGGTDRRIVIDGTPVVVRLGGMADVDVAVLQRHGPQAATPPHRIDHAANLRALREAGVDRVVGIGSAGSLREDVELPALFVPDDYISWADPTIFTDRVHHVTPGFDEAIRRELIASARAMGARVVDRGTYWQTRGPRLETRAEIAFLRRFADAVGMTLGSEATVARELGIRYAALCTLDNLAHGLRGAVPTEEEIRARASENAAACLRAIEGAVPGISR